MEVEERRRREEDEDVDEEEEEEEVVVGRATVDEAWAARASAMGSAVSPSKNLAMAIWTFHWLRRRMGRAAEGSRAVTAVNCWRASCWEGVSWERSASKLELELAMVLWGCVRDTILLI